MDQPSDNAQDHFAALFDWISSGIQPLVATSPFHRIAPVPSPSLIAALAHWQPAVGVAVHPEML